MATSAPSWDFSDAWVLTAIAVHEAPCSLTDVVSAADAMNHAIVMASELSQAIGRLSASGLVTVNGDQFALTDRGQALEVVPGLVELEVAVPRSTQTVR